MLITRVGMKSIKYKHQLLHKVTILFLIKRFCAPKKAIALSASHPPSACCMPSHPRAYQAPLHLRSKQNHE